MRREIFPQLLGNEWIKRNLAVDVVEGKSAHAYIIEGAPGSGKRLLAKLLCAASVCQNRENPIGDVPCGVCPTCRRIMRDISADVNFITLNGKASIGVEAVRAMKQTLYITPNDADKKFYIIENAELMTVQAQNTLLLSLEEPPEYVMILLLTTQASALLETIRSRAPVIRMEIFTPGTVLEYLKSGRSIRSDDYGEESLVEAAYLSHGSIGQAISNLTAEEGVKPRALAAQLAEKLVNKARASETFLLLNELSGDRETVLQTLPLAQVALRDMIVMKRTEDEGNFLFYRTAEDMPENVSRVSVKRLIYLYDLILNAYENISMNGSVAAALTDLILKKDKNR